MAPNLVFRHAGHNVLPLHDSVRRHVLRIVSEGVGPDQVRGVVGVVVVKDGADVGRLDFDHNAVLQEISRLQPSALAFVN
ncbi:hypothetical protein PpBr36_07261 [Pyricularia pennisetigena]|uniref:hypothetical protein n=1 Tax=Pyricularia pennisetigena TaxID=1578925 RepID=UPI0011501E3C|nr:hypothetical protein PpBr36_07261 [Pyricularia pennisetigena]TLS25785.1 hypothetical protein PpBr36_07261 [Pyricularia pennisetigena]